MCLVLVLQRLGSASDNLIDQLEAALKKIHLENDIEAVNLGMLI